MQIETLKTFLSDPEIQAQYGIDKEKVKSITMTSPENNIMVVLIKELIIKQAEANSNNIAASQLNTLLDNRLK
jgi:hypothetical protein